MKKIIYEILEEIVPFEDVNDETRLLEEEIIDSLTLVYLINEIEEKTGIHITEEEVKPENFICVNSIVELLNRLK